MDRNLRDQWIVALRSGQYKQTQGELFDGTGYCCLGVYLAATGLQRSDGSFDPDSHDGEELSHSLRDDIGLDSSNQEILINMNDDQDDPKDFPQIAQWIEENL